MGTFGQALPSPQLTPAARRLLDDVTKELHTEILSSARNRATLYGSTTEEISVRDVIAALDETGIAPRQPRQIGWVLRFLGFLVFVAFAMTITTIGAQLARTNELRSLTLGISTALAAMLASFIGAVALVEIRGTRSLRFSIRSYPLYSRFYLGREGIEADPGSFLSKWIELEAAMRVRVADALGESHSAQPLSTLIMTYSEIAHLPSNDITRLHELLRLRNHIAHDPTPIDRGQLRKGLQDIEDLLARLSVSR